MYFHTTKCVNNCVMYVYCICLGLIDWHVQSYIVYECFTQFNYYCIILTVIRNLLREFYCTCCAYFTAHFRILSSLIITATNTTYNYYDKNECNYWLHNFFTANECPSIYLCKIECKYSHIQHKHSAILLISQMVIVSNFAQNTPGSEPRDGMVLIYGLSAKTLFYRIICN